MAGTALDQLPLDKTSLVSFSAPVVGNGKWAKRMSEYLQSPYTFEPNYMESDKNAMFGLTKSQALCFEDKEVPCALRVVESQDAVASNFMGINGGTVHVGRTLYSDGEENAKSKQVLIHTGAKNEKEMAVAATERVHATQTIRKNLLKCFLGFRPPPTLSSDSFICPKSNGKLRDAADANDKADYIQALYNDLPTGVPTPLELDATVFKLIWLKDRKSAF